MMKSARRSGCRSSTLKQIQLPLVFQPCYFHLDTYCCQERTFWPPVMFL